MAYSDQKSLQRTQKMSLGSSFAAGGLMLSHLNRSGITRYDDLLADLCKLHERSRSTLAETPDNILGPTPKARMSQQRTAKRRNRWVDWIYR